MAKGGKARAAAEEAPPEDGERVSVGAGRAIPNIIVEVLPDNTVNSAAIDTDKVATVEPHGPGDTFEIEGPTAIALVQGGHVKIVGSVEP
jgi:hypothetical protein